MQLHYWKFEAICIRRKQKNCKFYFILIFVTLYVWFLKGSHEPVFSKWCYRNNWPEKYHWCSVSIYFSFRFALSLSPFVAFDFLFVVATLFLFWFDSHFFVSRFNLGIFYE